MLVSVVLRCLIGLMLSVGVPSAGAASTGYDYDAAAATRVGPQAGESAEDGLPLATGLRDRFGSPPVEAQRATTTPALFFVAPNTTHRFPDTADGMTQRLGVDPVVSVTKDGTPRNRWFPNERTRTTMESHPEGLAPGAPGFNPRHHGEHFHVQIRPDSTTGWNNPAVTKSHPPGYTPGSGTGFLPGEEFPS